MIWAKKVEKYGKTRGFRGYLLGVVAVALLSLLFFTGCKRVSSERTKIVTSTSLIGTVAKVIGKDRVEVVIIVPGGMCPGHFDLKPGDIDDLSTARLFLNHGWERWIDGLVELVENGNLTAKTVRTEGNWMVPEVQKRAADEVAEILSLVDPQNRDRFMDNSFRYKETVDSVAVEMRKSAEDLEGTRTLCSEYQAEFLEWLGFKIIATYGRPGELTPKQMIELMRKASSESVEIVVDNLQSGSTVGKQIAEEAGAKWVVLTFFPRNGSYIDALRENVNKLIETLRND